MIVEPPVTDSDIEGVAPVVSKPTVTVVPSDRERAEVDATAALSVPLRPAGEIVTSKVPELIVAALPKAMLNPLAESLTRPRAPVDRERAGHRLRADGERGAGDGDAGRGDRDRDRSGWRGRGGGCGSGTVRSTVGDPVPKTTVPLTPVASTRPLMQADAPLTVRVTCAAETVIARLPLTCDRPERERQAGAGDRDRGAVVLASCTAPDIAKHRPR